MARRSSPISSQGPRPLDVSQTSLDRRWVQLSQSLAEALELHRQEVLIQPEYLGEQVWAGLVGRGCERARRQRGGFSYVAPLTNFPRGLTAWLGLQEVWDLSARDSRKFTFRYLSLTVHFGFAGDPVKPQVFRSEWSGFRDWTGAGPGFQSPGAGHPHWQFDVNEAIREAKQIGELEFDRPDAEVVEDFEAEPLELDVWAMLRSATIERMHFASAAPWWMRQVADANPWHMNAPVDEQGLSRWLLACIAYLRQELVRCEIRSR